jgi:hypothetical protein
MLSARRTPSFDKEMIELILDGKEDINFIESLV